MLIICLNTTSTHIFSYSTSICHYSDHFIKRRYNLDMKTPFIWDPYSDQPYPIKDKIYKKEMRKKAWLSLLKTLLISLIMLPLSLLAMPFIRPKNIDNHRFFGLGVDLDKEPAQSVELIEELGVDSLIIRFKLWEMERLDAYLAFVRSFEGKEILLNIMQDREHIEDSALLESDIKRIFEAFSPYVNTFQIGTTINRAKWGFFSMDEYLKFFQVTQQVKERVSPEISLIGSGVIDFEYHFTAHTLFNFFKIRYDGVASLLYVDRRGAPENGQLGFTLSDKISLLSSLIRLSPKTANKLFVTETNWPISNTAPYAPTSELECVDESAYADYLLRYYLLAFASQQVDAIYWHQLIAPGYGLIDNREGVRKRAAFYTFKMMLASLSEAQFLRLDIKRGLYSLHFNTRRGLLNITWTPGEQAIALPYKAKAYDRDGEEIYDKVLYATQSPIYIFMQETRA